MPLPLPDKPSIAVLPFTSIGGDAKQERLADGITEDVITDLSRYRDLFVIARNSVMTYKGRAVSVRDVGRDLGVGYVLEGSIQTSGDNVRITAQLIEAATNTHVWSERYDRALGDIFELQNEVTQKIAAALGRPSGVMIVADAANARRKPAANLQADDYYLLGLELILRQQSKPEISKAEEFLKKAIELDPQFARAYLKLGVVYEIQGDNGWGQDDIPALYERAKVNLLKATALDSTDGIAYAVLGNIYCVLGDFDHGLAALDQAYVLNPSDPDTLVYYGVNLVFVGRAREGIEMTNRAFRLNPHYPDWYYNNLDPFYATGQYDQVIRMARRKTGPTIIWVQVLLTISYAQLGRQTDTAAAVRTELSRRYPEFSMERALSDFGAIPDEPTRAHYMDGVRQAGLNECATQPELQKYPKMTHLALGDAQRATN